MDLSADLANHPNRYAWVGEELWRVGVRFGWGAMAFAEIRDLNRHRTGNKHCPLRPKGFYAASDQLPVGEETATFGDLAAVGRAATAEAHGLLAAGGGRRLGVLVPARRGVAIALGLVLLLGLAELAGDAGRGVRRLAHREGAQRLDDRVVAHEHELRVHDRAAGAVAGHLAGDDLVTAQELPEGARVVGGQRLLGREARLVERVDDVLLGEHVQVLAGDVRNEPVAHGVGRLHALAAGGGAEHAHAEARRAGGRRDALLGRGRSEREASDEARGDGGERLVIPSHQ